MPPPVSNTSPIKRKRRFLKWGGFALALLMAGGMGAGMNQASNSGRIFVSSQDRARLDQLRKEDQISRTMTSSITEQRQRLQDELSRRLEDLERAKEDAQRAAERGLTSALEVKPLDLTGYEYPRATGGQYSRIPGKELLTQRTTDDFETISQFYQQKLGKPYVELNERDRKRVLYQSSNSPSASVLVQESRDRTRQWEIIILRSPFLFPKPDESLNTAPALVEAKPLTVEVKPLAPLKPAAPAAPVKAPKVQE